MTIPTTEEQQLLEQGIESLLLPQIDREVSLAILVKVCPTEYDAIMAESFCDLILNRGFDYTRKNFPRSFIKSQMAYMKAGGFTEDILRYISDLHRNPIDLTAPETKKRLFDILHKPVNSVPSVADEIKALPRINKVPNWDIPYTCTTIRRMPGEGWRPSPNPYLLARQWWRWNNIGAEILFFVVAAAFFYFYI